MSALGLRAYARHRRAAGLTGGTLRAVQEAIACGRLSASLTADRAQIASAEAADLEWAASTYEDRIPISGPGAVASTAPPPPASPDGSPPPLAVSRAKREAALAAKAEHELAQLRGEFVRVEDARRELRTLLTDLRNRMLGIPSKLRNRGVTPDEHRRIAPIVDDLVREALEDFASGRIAGMRADGEEGDEEQEQEQEEPC